MDLNSLLERYVKAHVAFLTDLDDLNKDAAYISQLIDNDEMTMDIYYSFLKRNMERGYRIDRGMLHLRSLWVECCDFDDLNIDEIHSLLPKGFDFNYPNFKLN